MSFHIIDYVFFGILLVFSLYSLYKGFLKRISGFVACIASFAVTWLGFHYVVPSTFAWSDSQKAIIFVCTFAVLWVLFRLIMHRFSNAISNTIILGAADKVLGLLVGLIQSAIIIYLISCILCYLAKDYALQSYIIQHIIHFI